MSSQYSQTQIPNSYLDGQEKPGVAGRALKALRLHPMISLALVLVIILQVRIIILALLKEATTINDTQTEQNLWDRTEHECCQCDADMECV